MDQQRNTWVILVAGGSGNRFAAPQPKQFLPLNGKTLMEHSLEVFGEMEEVGGLVLVLPAEHLESWQRQWRKTFSFLIRFTEGGSTRQQSVEQGLKQVPKDAEWVVIHDAARPLMTLDVLERCLQGALETGAAVAAIPVADTLKRGGKDSQVLETIPREGLFQIQTPQVFKRQVLADALTWAREQGLDATDEATLVEKMGRPVRLVVGAESNLKVTRPADLKLAEAILLQRGGPRMTPEIRIGQGYDVHPYVKGRDLILGGVKIPFELGLQGHSDADALLHAVGDALLGAVAAGDLGAHFPDSDPKFKNASSLILLEQVAGLIEKKGFQVANVDATLVCQRPKLAPHIPAMRENIARVLKVSPEQVSVKATTEEGLGFTGQMQGLAAKAVVLLHRLSQDRKQEV